MNATLTGLKFFFEVTLEQPEAMARVSTVRVPRKLPVILSRDEVARLIDAGPSLDVTQLIGGIRSSMGYTGCTSIKEMRTKPEFVRVTGAGMAESHVHDVQITKEAPNYRRMF